MTAASSSTAPTTPRVTLLLAHGAGAPMDSPAMTVDRRGARRGRAPGRALRVRLHGRPARRAARKPPPRAETLKREYRAAVDGARPATGRLVIGGKSMGGRVASMVADELHAAGGIAGLLCLGYPFHPPGRPEQLRTAHLAGLATPALICQGTRDPFGTREEVAGLRAVAGDRDRSGSRTATTT